MSQDMPIASYTLSVAFWKNGTSCGIASRTNDFAYSGFSVGGQTYNARSAFNVLLEYCTAGTTLTCNYSATWYRIYQ